MEAAASWLSCVLVGERADGDGVGGLAECRLHDQWLFELEQRDALGTDPRRLALALQLQTLEDLLRRNRDFIDPHADGVVDGVRDGRQHGQEWPLPGFLGAEWSFGVVGFDQDRVDLGRLERRRTLVLEKRGMLV